MSRKLPRLNLKMSGGEVFAQMFRCCVTEEQTRAHHQTRRRIDRTMIGNPTNFRHTAHIGTSDLMVPGGGGSSNNNQLNDMQSQMKSKGGYEATSTSLHVPTLINARSLDEVRRK